MIKTVRRTTALSLACAASCAMAQVPPDRWPPSPPGSTNVQVYGMVDSGVEYLSNTNAAGDSVVRVPTLSGTFPSNIGFRGGEDLGGGLKALFNLELGYSVDTGVLQNGGRTFGRSAWVGLQGRYGTLMLGRMINMTYIANLRSNVLGPSIHSYPNLDNYLPNARSDNTIGYIGKFDKLTVGATFSTGRDATAVVAGPASTACPGELGADKKACRQVTAMLAYDTPKYGMAMSWDVLNGGPNAGFGLTRSDYDDRRAGINGYFMVDKLKTVPGDNAPVDSWDLIFNANKISKPKQCGVPLRDPPSATLPLAPPPLSPDPSPQQPDDDASTDLRRCGAQGAGQGPRGSLCGRPGLCLGLAQRPQRDSVASRGTHSHLAAENGSSGG